jgi:hypothetical protein
MMPALHRNNSLVNARGRVQPTYAPLKKPDGGTSPKIGTYRPVLGTFHHINAGYGPKTLALIGSRPGRNCRRSKICRGPGRLSIRPFEGIRPSISSLLVLNRFPFVIDGLEEDTFSSGFDVCGATFGHCPGYYGTGSVRGRSRRQGDFVERQDLMPGERQFRDEGTNRIKISKNSRNSGRFSNSPSTG